jgi:hypothetical protein
VRPPNPLPITQVGALGLHLAAPSSLQSLDRSYICMQVDGSAALGLYVAALSSLQSLDRSYICMQVDGAAALGLHLAALVFAES